MKETPTFDLTSHFRVKTRPTRSWFALLTLRYPYLASCIASYSRNFSGSARRLCMVSSAAHLRFDFSTGQNFGHIFINFIDNAGMIALLDK